MFIYIYYIINICLSTYIMIIQRRDIDTESHQCMLIYNISYYQYMLIDIYYIINTCICSSTYVIIPQRHVDAESHQCMFIYIYYIIYTCLSTYIISSIHIYLQILSHHSTMTWYWYRVLSIYVYLHISYYPNVFIFVYYIINISLSTCIIFHLRRDIDDTHSVARLAVEHIYIYICMYIYTHFIVQLNVVSDSGWNAIFPKGNMYTRTHTHAHTHTHTHAHTCTHMHTYTHTHTHIHTHTYRHTHTLTNTHTQTLIHTHNVYINIQYIHIQRERVTHKHIHDTHLGTNTN